MRVWWQNSELRFGSHFNALVAHKQTNGLGRNSFHGLVNYAQIFWAEQVCFKRQVTGEPQFK